MDMNELKGKVLKVNLARPAATVVLNPQANKASASLDFFFYKAIIDFIIILTVWESEEWLKEHVKPLAQAGGVQSRFANPHSKSVEPEEQITETNDAMEE